MKIFLPYHLTPISLFQVIAVATDVRTLMGEDRSLARADVTKADR